MYTDAVLDADGNETPEGILDAIVSVLIAGHNLKAAADVRNSRTESIYIVKPKMHGAEEVAMTATLFERVEDVLALPRNTLKMGIMDEEQRTTVNLEAAAAAADRDLLHHQADSRSDRRRRFIPRSKPAPRSARKISGAPPWIKAYEDWNVDTGLACALPGRAQIGKGMWAAPDQMADMLKQKVAHPLAERKHGLGAVTDRRQPCMPCTITEVDVALRQQRAERPRARKAGRHPLATVPVRALQLAAGRRCSRSSTTTSRAFSAMLCDGSIKGLAVRRFRISIMSA